VDHALRRRFAFIPLYPNYKILRRYHSSTGFPVDKLIQTLEQLNQEIGNPHYEVGISFFLRPQLTEQIESIWRLEIEPYLEEYFFNQPSKVNLFRWDKVKQQVFP
jgi:5-methylcytosine-specific restriction protein B